MSRDTFRPESHADTFSHAGEILEFAAVLDLIAAKCVNSGAKNEVRRIHPTTDGDLIGARLREIAEVREYHEAAGHLPIVETECRLWIEHALRRHELIPSEGFLAIASIERSVAEFQRSLREEPAYPLLRGVVFGMTVHRELVDAIEKAIDHEARIRDTASAKLKAIRRDIVRGREELRRFADQMAKSFGSSDYATYTGTRHVLLVPREKCRKKEGLVHSASHTGESLYFEPFPLVERNNVLETLLHDEREEETRILSELTSLVAATADELLENIRRWELLDALEAKARFASEFRCTSPAASADGSVQLVQARHPLLELSVRSQAGGGSVVPLDLSLEARSRVLVVTGPNAGGKTVALKTLGLAVLMFQSGLPVACGEGTRLPIFTAIHADIGDEQSIATSLSTFTSHLRHLDVMCRTSGPGTLCLIDEIGDGTDPDEGSALAIATLERLRSLGAAIVATTHYGKVKIYALKTDGVVNASMAFDDENDKPLYRLLQGTAGRSRGIETARRLGFDPSVVRQAETLLGDEPYRLENVLSQLESTQLSLEREKEALRAQSDALNRLIAKYSEKEEALAKFKEAQQDRVRKDTESLLVEARREIEALVKKIRESDAEKSAVSAAHHRVREMLEKVKEPPKPKRARRVVKGDMVSVSPSGQPVGRVIEVTSDAAVVEIHGKRLTVRKSDLYEPGEGDREMQKAEIDIPVHVSAEPLHTTSVDVRGQSREEALEAVDQFLDRAVLAGVQEIRIIHGVGEGILLRAIRDLVSADTRVASSRQGGQGEGGVGVTVVYLK